jgi:hypothetical protein
VGQCQCKNCRELRSLAALRKAGEDLVLYLRKTVPAQVDLVATDVAAAGLADRLNNLEVALGLVQGAWNAPDPDPKN